MPIPVVAIAHNQSYKSADYRRHLPWQTRICVYSDGQDVPRASIAVHTMHTDSGGGSLVVALFDYGATASRE